MILYGYPTGLYQMMVSGMGLCMQLKRLGLSDFNNSVAIGVSEMTQIFDSTIDHLKRFDTLNTEINDPTPVIRDSFE
jgi:hypothetical protein